jgi:WD40 repeat protein
MQKMKTKTIANISFVFFAILCLLLCGFGIWSIEKTTGMSVSPNGKFLIVTSSTGISVYRLEDEKLLLHQSGQAYGAQPYQQGEYSHIAWSPDGTSLAIGKIYNGIWIWETDNWTLLTKKDSEEGIPEDEPGFAWSPDSQLLALGTGKGEIWIWNKKKNSWEIKKSYPGHITSITWAPNSRLLVLVGRKLYDVETGKSVADLNHWIDGYGKISWSPDNSHVFVFFDLGGGVMDAEENRFEYGAGYFPVFAWSHDGRFFASAEECSSEITIWDTLSNSAVLKDNSGKMLEALAWTPDGNLLGLGFFHGKRVIWDIHTGEIIMRMIKPIDLRCALD